MKKLALLLMFIISLSSEARLLQIIHTNDLHSYFLGYEDGRGGYARVKTKIDEIRSEANDQGIDVLQLDAGDFGDGTSFFLSQGGVNSIKALEMLGAEFSVIGNHDDLLGGKTLGDQIRAANVKTKFLSANLISTPDMNLKNIIFPYADIEKAGTSIRVIGLSTAELQFQYPLLPGIVLPPVIVANQEASIARKAKKKLIIALSHLGLNADADLAKKSYDIDLIVGGHSHDRLEEIRYEKNKLNKSIPIVQAGAHGLVVGSILLDIADDGKIHVVKYKLHEITSQIEEDPEMARYVEDAVYYRNQSFDGRWDEVIGQTAIPLSGYINGAENNKATCWGAHMAKMSQEATNSDLALHVAQFEGQAVAPGDITVGNLIENFPHIRKYGDRGWEISTITVSGKALKVILKGLINLKTYGINFYGVDYKVFKIPSFIPYLGNKEWAFGLRVKGQKINNSANYKISFPSEVGLALKQTLGDSVKKVMPDLKNTGIFYWDVMESYIKANSPIKCLNEKRASILKYDED